MAPRSLVAIFAGLATTAFAQDETTPVSKVIHLLEDLKTEVEDEGKAEAGTYDTFACFCKDKTTEKSTSITEGRDTIDGHSATIQDKTAEKESKETELKKRKEDHEAWSAELSDTEIRFEKATAEYDATAADLNKAISSLEGAIKAMQDSKPADSLLMVRRTVQALRGMVSAPKQKAISKLLQAKVDPSDPTYEYHSQGIIDTLKGLESDFKSEKSELDTEWGKTKGTFETTITGLGDKIRLNTNAMGLLETSLETLKGDIATARSDLVTAESLLKDDQLYLKDLTSQCEDRAKDWDQRSKMRADELEALSGALAVLKGDVKSLDTEVNKRALLQAPKPAKNVTEASARVVTISKHMPAAPALLQLDTKAAGRNLRGANAAAMTTQMKQDKIVSLLGHEGQRLNSAVLSSLAMKLSADPFGKVKTLIQQLIERLLAEATAEATKKGFCDTEVSKAKEDRSARLADTQRLDVDIKGLSIKKDELEAEIELLSNEATQLRDDLAEAATNRDAEKENNIDAIKKAKEGLVAVKQAISILKLFYKNAAKAQSFVQYSPVEDDTTGAGFSSNYAGKQERSKGIIGMLEVIEADFDRTARHTDAAEKKAHEEFIEFDRVSKADISGKEMKVQLDQEDLETTKNKIDQKMGDITAQQKLLDSALKRIEELKPTCIDTGMSYEDRVAKREEEVAALKNALCILDTEGVEAECA